MSQQWTGKIVALMHTNRITQKELAKEMGISQVWMSQIMNGHVNPPGTRQRVENAVNAILERRNEA